MKKIFGYWLPVLAGLFFLIMTSCTTEKTQPTPTMKPEPTRKPTLIVLRMPTSTGPTPTLYPTPTMRPTSTTPQPAPVYIHFTPAAGSLFEVEFDYPDNWVFLDDPSYLDNTYLIYDPVIQPAPSRPKQISDFHPDWADIRITVYQVDDPKASMAEFIDIISGWALPEHRNFVISEISIWTIDAAVVEDMTTEIDGYPSHQLKMRTVDEWSGMTLIIIHRFVYIAAEDRLYSFELSVLESEQDGAFATAFEHMIESIQFIR